MALDLLTLVFILGAPEAAGVEHLQPQRPIQSSLATLAPEELHAETDTTSVAVTGAEPDLSRLSISVPLVPRVQHFIGFFQGRGRFIYAKWYSRMARYEPMIKDVLARYELPPI